MHLKMENNWIKKYLISGNDLWVQCTAELPYTESVYIQGCKVKIESNKSTGRSAEKIYAKQRINFQFWFGWRTDGESVK